MDNQFDARRLVRRPPRVPARFDSARARGGARRARFPHATWLLLAGFVTVALGADSALAWGPLTHVQLSGELLGNLSLLPAGIAALLARHSWHYVYGNVAADIVFAKKLSRIKQICHHWTTGFSILDACETEADRAFAYGYLSHLAADTVAHNKYLPRQMAMSRSTINFGHLYWEVRADAMTEADCWQRMRETLRQDFPGARTLLEKHLRSTLLSFGANRRVFNQLNLLVSLRSWRRSVSLWSRVSRWPLAENVLGDYRDESLDRMVDLLTHLSSSSVLHEDPNGNAALGYARIQRRQLRQMLRARMPLGHVVAEAANVHAPRRRTRE
jgi:hypothetical protein